MATSDQYILKTIKVVSILPVMAILHTQTSLKQ